MTLDEKLDRITELKKIRDKATEELESLIAGTTRKKLTCSKCGSDEHTARTCTVVQSQ